MGETEIPGEKKSKKKIIIIAVIVVLLAIIGTLGFVIYTLVNKQEVPKAPRDISEGLVVGFKLSDDIFSPFRLK